MDHFIEIYLNKADKYHQMILPEDVDSNLLPALEQIAPLNGKHVLDLGTGTGRLPLLFADKTAQMACLDLHSGMLLEHKRWQGQWGLLQGDMRTLPFQSNWADVVTAGWAIGHFTGWYGTEAHTQIGRVLNEMQRVTAPGGAIIIMETLTTGSLTPAPPSDALANYYAWLENEWGFTRQEISTDYQFADVEEAAQQVEFFFGAEMSNKVKTKGWARLPEWTGIWSKQV